MKNLYVSISGGTLTVSDELAAETEALAGKLKDAGFYANVYVDAVRDLGAFERFPKVAKAFGVDVRKILDKVAPKPKPEATEAKNKKADK